MISVFPSMKMGIDLTPVKAFSSSDWTEDIEQMALKAFTQEDIDGINADPEDWGKDCSRCSNVSYNKCLNCGRIEI